MLEHRREGALAHARSITLVDDYLKKAIAELDRINAPPDIAAHLDTARHRLKEVKEEPFPKRT